MAQTAGEGPTRQPAGPTHPAQAEKETPAPARPALPPGDPAASPSPTAIPLLLASAKPPPASQVAPAGGGTAADGKLTTPRADAPPAAAQALPLPAAPSTPPAPAAAPSPPLAEQLTHALVAQADVATRDGRIDFHLHLEPANLGTVHVYLTASDQTVSARIVAAHDSTQAALAGQAHELRAALTQAGVSLGSFDLAGGQGGGQGGSPGHPGDQGGPPPSSAGAAAPPRPNGTTGPSPTVVAVGINLLA